jgi:hypothetical protein
VDIRTYSAARTGLARSPSSSVARLDVMDVLVGLR